MDGTGPPFPRILFSAVGQDFWRKHHLCMCREQRGTKSPSVGSIAVPADGRIVHKCKFFCHHTGRRLWELPGKKYTKTHLCVFNKYTFNE